jgi:hypothetical protein
MENPNVMDEGNTKSNTPQEWTIGSNPEDLGIVCVEHQASSSHVS